MGRHLIERQACKTCGQPVETLDDGRELGHADSSAPPPAEVPDAEPATAVAPEPAVEASTGGV